MKSPGWNIPLSKYCLLLLVLLGGTGLFAREVAILVMDADLGIPLEGALVRSWDGTEYPCGEDGTALVEVPGDRRVVIRVGYPGYENGELLIPLTGDRFSLALHMDGVLENAELVLEVQHPGNSETKSGRSVAISGEALSRTAEIGFIEDVMTSIKLLPGVGYSGMFNAKPSIRGGDPGDLTAVMDGFYIEQPYHWGGAYSIFVPQMVESARLSHGIFSGRYGHTISGLLEINTKKPSSTEPQLDIGVSTSETNLGVSYPLGSKGGVMATGKVTYWDPFIWGAQQLAKEVPELDILNTITTAPFIRDFALTADYRFSADLDVTLTGFFGSDGVGAEYHNIFDEEDQHREVDLQFDWMNYQIFGITGLTWSPDTTWVIRATLGAGYYAAEMLADINFRRSGDLEPLSRQNAAIKAALTDATINYQGRADFDRDLGSGIIFAAGIQELYSQWVKTENYRTRIELFVPELPEIPELPDTPELPVETPGSPPGNRGDIPMNYSLDIKNQGLSTSAYTLVEYAGPSRFGAEAGLRVDHFYFIGRDFTIQTMPVFNPRLNIDFKVLKNFGPIDSLTVTAGAGLFSSMNDAISSIDINDGIKDFGLKPNRSWTSLAGAKIDFARGISFNIEGYYKHVFDRAYTVTSSLYPDTADQKTTIEYRFDGIGRIAGFDFQLQKMESPRLDGWLSYSFTWAQYRDPGAVPDPLPEGADPEVYPLTGTGWYYPAFHRYHTINLVMNIKPSPTFAIGLRFGFASGKPEEDDNSRRTGFSWPVDVKFSFFRFKPQGKLRSEMYLGIENLQSLVYDAIWIARVNGYTGEEEMNEYTPVYDLPIPMVSFGFKWRF